MYDMPEPSPKNRLHAAKECASFYWDCIKETFDRSLGVSDLLASIFGMVVPPIAKHFGARESTMTDLYWQVPLFAFAGFGVCRLFLSPYFIYKFQKDRAKRLEEEAEYSLSPEINFVSLHYPTHPSGTAKETLAIIRMSIRNRGEQTILEKWNVYVDLVSGDRVKMSYFYIVDVIYLDGQIPPENASWAYRKANTIKPEDGIMKKSLLPIPKGGIVAGPLPVHFAGYGSEELGMKGTKYFVEFSDVGGKKYCCPFEMAEPTTEGGWASPLEL
jgi:hypothetical protein